MLMFLLTIICLYPSLVDKLWTKCPCWQTVNKMSLLTNCEQNVLVDKLWTKCPCWQTEQNVLVFTNCEQNVLVDKLWTRCPCWQTVNKMSLLTNCEQNVLVDKLWTKCKCCFFTLFVCLFDYEHIRTWWMVMHTKSDIYVLISLFLTNFNCLS